LLKGPLRTQLQVGTHLFVAPLNVVEVSARDLHRRGFALDDEFAQRVDGKFSQIHS